MHDYQPKHCPNCGRVLAEDEAGPFCEDCEELGFELCDEPGCGEVAKHSRAGFNWCESHWGGDDDTDDTDQ